jgi:hypothetical protein
VPFVRPNLGYNSFIKEISKYGKSIKTFAILRIEYKALPERIVTKILSGVIKNYIRENRIQFLI